jgi:hypothetical protein
VLPLDEPTSYGELAISLPLDIIATVLDITMVGWSYVISSGKVSISSTEPEIAGHLGREMAAEKNRRSGFGMECKRVNSTRSLLAQKYVDDGIMRFVTGKYSPGHDWAAMLGFVIDGSCNGCINMIRNHLTQKCQETCMEEGWALDTRFGAIPNLYGTSHRQQGRSFLFRLLHLFLVIS